MELSVVERCPYCTGLRIRDLHVGVRIDPLH